MKYQLLLKDILKYTKRAGEDPTSLEKAIEVMRVVPKAANDMMNVGRLQGFDVCIPFTTWGTFRQLLWRLIQRNSI